MAATPNCKYGGSCIPKVKDDVDFSPKASGFYGFGPLKNFDYTCMASSKFCAALRAAKYIRLQQIAYPAITLTNFRTLL